jgi:DNA-binding transcriptional LysR family regulator
MFLSSDGLAAFLQVVQTGSFSKAAKALHISQSAVSQRIANLEEQLTTTLFERNYHKLNLTPAGEELRTYCLTQQKMESQVLATIGNSRERGRLFGALRIAAFSSVLRSVILRALQPLLTENPGLQIETLSAEMHEMPALLRSARVDFIVIDNQIVKREVASHFLGEETNLLVEPLSGAAPNRYLDHDSMDSCTDRFRAIQKQDLPDAPRHYVDDIYGIIDGVELGLGRAVVAAHLLSEEARLRVVPGLLPLRIPVWLHHLRGDYETPLQRAVVQTLLKGTERFLEVPKKIKTGARISPKIAK